LAIRNAARSGFSASAAEWERALLFAMVWVARSAPAAFGFFRLKKAGVFRVEIKEKRHTFGFGFEIGFTVGGIHGAVERLVALEQNGWHGQRIVKIGKHSAFCYIKTKWEGFARGERRRNTMIC